MTAINRLSRMSPGAASNGTCGCFFVHNDVRSGELGGYVCLVRTHPESPAGGQMVIVTWLATSYFTPDGKSVAEEHARSGGVQTKRSCLCSAQLFGGDSEAAFSKICHRGTILLGFKCNEGTAEVWSEARSC